jgi:hypothetical protein
MIELTGPLTQLTLTNILFESALDTTMFYSGLDIIMQAVISGIAQMEASQVTENNPVISAAQE